VIIITITNKQLSEKELSQIFNVVKHPLRRGILKLLSNGPLSYTTILKSLEIPESSILNYHLREMDDLLINKDVNGKYLLNDIGEICVQLILRVKEKEDIHSINKLQLAVEKLKSTLFLIQIVFLPLLVILALELYLLNIINFGSILEIFTSSVIFSTIFGASFIVINKELGIILEKKEKIGNYSILFTIWILVQTIFTLIW
jgi:hypothetical protein